MVETQAKHKLEHEYWGQKKDERILWHGGGRGSRVANTELVSARASEDEDEEFRKRQALNVDHRARVLEHQEDEEHEHHELASTEATTNAQAHGHANTNTNTKKKNTWQRGGMKGYDLKKSKSFSPKNEPPLLHL